MPAIRLAVVSSSGAESLSFTSSSDDTPASVMHRAASCALTSGDSVTGSRSIRLPTVADSRVLPDSWRETAFCSLVRSSISTWSAKTSLLSNSSVNTGSGSR